MASQGVGGSYIATYASKWPIGDKRHAAKRHHGQTEAATSEPVRRPDDVRAG